MAVQGLRRDSMIELCITGLILGLIADYFWWLK